MTNDTRSSTAERVLVKARDLEWNRREFLSNLAKSAVTVAGAGALAPACSTSGGKSSPARSERKKVVIIATVVRKYSHAQHFIDRFVEGYGWHGQHHHPPVALASLYVDQFPDNDLARER